MKKGDTQKKVKENTAFIVNGDMGIVYDKSSINLTCRTNDLVIDSGALFYVTNQYNYFASYVNGDYDYVRIRNKHASLDCENKRYLLINQHFM